jgi:hypothetical protein
MMGKLVKKNILELTFRFRCKKANWIQLGCQRHIIHAKKSRILHIFILVSKTEFNSTLVSIALFSLLTTMIINRVSAKRYLHVNFGICIINYKIKIAIRLLFLKLGG